MVTLLLTASASGQYIKPFMLHPAAVNSEMAESMNKYFEFHSKSSWMTNDLFLYYLKNVSTL